MISSIHFLTNWNIILGFFPVKTMIKNDMFLTTKIIENVWNWKLISLDRKYSYYVKKELVMISY